MQFSLAYPDKWVCSLVVKGWKLMTIEPWPELPLSEWKTPLLLYICRLRLLARSSSNSLLFRWNVEYLSLFYTVGQDKLALLLTSSTWRGNDK